MPRGRKPRPDRFKKYLVSLNYEIMELFKMQCRDHGVAYSAKLEQLIREYLESYSK